MTCKQLGDSQKGTGSSEERAVPVPLLAIGLRLPLGNCVTPINSLDSRKSRTFRPTEVIPVLDSPHDHPKMDNIENDFRSSIVNDSPFSARLNPRDSARLCMMQESACQPLIGGRSANLSSTQTSPMTHDQPANAPGKTSATALAPLFVDLDGTLLATDLLWESALELVRNQPLAAFQLPIWLLRGRAYLKRQIAERVELSVATLPYRAEVLDLLKREREAGRSLILATASERLLAEPVAEHLGLFDGVIASDGTRNLKGSTKLAAIQEWAGSGVPFGYVGDSTADLPIWQAAERVVVVNPGRSLLGQIQRDSTEPEVIQTPGGLLKPMVKAIRPHQWAKNVLLFVPVITAHRLRDLPTLAQASAAFLAFGFAASSGYLFNDLLDLKSDRRHKSKHRRPIASGRLPIPIAIGLFGLLLVSSLGVAIALSPTFLAMVVLYLFLTTAYSLYFKRKLMVDVICLGGLYTHRILAGGVATSIVISTWLLAFSMFLFLSLAFVKRYTELDGMPAEADGKSKLSGRGYMPGDIDMVRSVGTSCGCLAVLVVCLYINSPDVTILYRHAKLLWLACPVIFYWIMRIWFLAQRREMSHDPVVFALGDKISYLAGATLAVILALAT